MKHFIINAAITIAIIAFVFRVAQVRTVVVGQ
jgi:hypothetical protein